MTRITRRQFLERMIALGAAGASAALANGGCAPQPTPGGAAQPEATGAYLAVVRQSVPQPVNPIFDDRELHPTTTPPAG